MADLSVHHRPKGVSDRIADGFTKALRFCADTFFAKRYAHCAIVLETVAGVPGMVGATIIAVSRGRHSPGGLKPLFVTGF